MLCRIGILQNFAKFIQQHLGPCCKFFWLLFIDVSRDFFKNTVFSRGFWGREVVQKYIIVVTVDEQFSVINMYEWYGQGLFTMENVIIMYLSIVLEIVLGESSFKITLIFLVLCLA